MCILGGIVKNSMAGAGVLRALSCRLAFFRRNFQHYRGINVQSGKSDVFYHALWRRLLGGPGSATPVEDSRILGALARTRCDPAKKSTVKHVTFGPEVAPFPSERRGPFPDPPPLSRK